VTSPSPNVFPGPKTTLAQSQSCWCRDQSSFSSLTAPLIYANAPGGTGYPARIGGGPSAPRAALRDWPNIPLFTSLTRTPKPTPSGPGKNYRPKPSGNLRPAEGWTALLIRGVTNLLRTAR